MCTCALRWLYHEVDSNEMASKMAATLAFRKAFSEVHRCYKKPIMKVEVIAQKNSW